MNGLQIPFEATNKELHFVSDPELAQIMIGILSEIDSLSLIKAHRSMIYLSMSTLEGILANVLKLNENKVRALPGYPKVKGAPKKWEKLTLEDEIKIARDLNIISTDFHDVFHKFRGFRNYMHPLVELQDRNSLDLGLGQIALGLLNHTISKLEKIRFIDEKIWKVITGIPKYTSGMEKIELPFISHGTNSFMVTDDYKNQDIELEFDLHIGGETVFNFVFDFENDSVFKMFRLDSRGEGYVSVLNCEHKYGWEGIPGFTDQCTLKSTEPNKLKIRIENSILTTHLDGNPLLSGKTIACDNKKSIGFFSEVRSLYMRKLLIKKI